MVGQFEVLQQVLPGEEVLRTGETLEGDGRSVRGGVVLQAGFPLERFITVRTLESGLSQLVGDSGRLASSLVIASPSQHPPPATPPTSRGEAHSFSQEG